VGAPVLQRVNLAALAAVQDDPFARERRSERIALPHGPGLSNRVPEIRIDPDAPKVSDGLGRVIMQVAQVTRRSSPDGLILGGKRLGHELLPRAQALIPQAGNGICGVDVNHEHPAAAAG